MDRRSAQFHFPECNTILTPLLHHIANAPSTFMLDYEPPRCPSGETHEDGGVHGPGSLRVRSPRHQWGDSRVMSKFLKEPAHSEAGPLIKKRGARGRGTPQQDGQGHACIRAWRKHVCHVDLGSDDPDSPTHTLMRSRRGPATSGIRCESGAQFGSPRSGAGLQ